MIVLSLETTLLYNLIKRSLVGLSFTSQSSLVFIMVICLQTTYTYTWISELRFTFMIGMFSLAKWFSALSMTWETIPFTRKCDASMDSIADEC